MNKGMVSAVALLATLACSNAGTARSIRCDACRDDASFRAEAVAAGEGTHLVFSVETGVVQQWYVGPGGGDEGRKPVDAPDTSHPPEPAPSAKVMKQVPPPEAEEEVRHGQAPSAAAAADQAAAFATKPPLGAATIN